MRGVETESPTQFLSRLGPGPTQFLSRLGPGPIIQR